MRTIFICAALLSATPAVAGTNVTLSGTLTSSCTLTLSAGGTLAVAPSGTVLSSESAGGTAATLTMTAVGSNPTVTFAAPDLAASPSGWSGTPTLEVKYTSTGGANQAYTSAQSSYAENRLLDTFTVHGRITDSAGFAAGTYTLRTVATCS
ncbi:hypothetical protein ABDK56_00055 [Sphingomonas sp. ASV193]|uniref:hypothetical protein n=1 Tax=Sphingomonas sp. ASV193 TaxID=3144405 RepID=UPI0032E8DCD1